MSEGGTELDLIARMLALQAGVVWDDLNDYPGYNRNYWRDEARGLIAVIAPTAVFREPRGNRWDAATG